MSPDAHLTLLTIGAVFATLIFTRVSADLVLAAAMAVLLVLGVLTPEQALVGFSNPGVLTVAVLYVIAAGLKQTGAVRWLADQLLGVPRSARGAQFRLIAPTAGLSAFMNNTAVVAMFIPAVQEWSRRLGLSASRLLMPLSYFAILGGTCTLIGTSTNLVVDGLIQSTSGDALGLFELAWVGVPLILVGSIVFLLIAHRFLPDRGGLMQQMESAREYSVDMRVPEASFLAGKTIVEAGLRNLAYGYLMEIERGGRLMSAVGPETVLEAGDLLRFIGEPRCADEVRSIRGLAPANGGSEKLALESHRRCLIEVVLGPDFPGLGKNVRDARFRSNYGAAILAISRRGERLKGKIGDIRLQVGDTLLLEGSPDFVDQYRFRRDFLLVSLLNDAGRIDHRKAPLSALILVGMVLLNVVGLLSVFESALVAAGAMLATRCVTSTQARRAIDYQVLTVIAASFALGQAMQVSGAADSIAGLILGDASLHPWVALALVYLITAIMTELITNNAAAVLMFPIAVALANQLDVSFMPYAITVMFAASASFLSPIGYQTNLMVMGPGGYHFTDYLRTGLPMTLAVGSTVVGLVPLIWGF
ncbi:di/tricarboxylate transporter [Tamilnaduibacter salinus]|uniref:Di/tricarboxylate transporter n=1 Tax=Tamilnaduibacter salinus TaxID=1484056 RepID=A0A2U1CUS2_9GAMM|nr:SLC13 family permease [Tamilnaduibacter salinus]PVY70806.1 di/tricarboxylate transporter [Tamilnaduibacter salinus]